jgi:uncharacterized protein YjbI with pentapeptide repeats
MKFKDLYEVCESQGACREGLEWLARQSRWKCFLSRESLEKGYLAWLTDCVGSARPNIYPLLSGANLTKANLSGADLSGANLSGADLSGADLSGANLYYANLTEANLTGTKLTGADISRANLTGANLTGANLAGMKRYNP